MNNEESGRPGQADRRGYFGEIVQSAKSIMEGMAITFAELTRYAEGMNHITVQYPDRTPIPVVDSLPERYRGFLEVDMAICTGCKACERDCPIDVIAIDLEKVDGQRVMTRFDIDMGKCMYCGICVESCPVEGNAPGDTEITKAIRMTREFEAATSDLNTLTFRFVRPGGSVAPFKPIKGETPHTERRGVIAREVRVKAADWNPIACDWALDHGGRKDEGSDADLITPEVVAARAVELELLVKPVVGDNKAVEDLIFNHALAQTDRGACGYQTCREYAIALATGADTESWKCEPGGTQATRDMTLIVELRKGKSAAEAAEATLKVAREHRK